MEKVDEKSLEKEKVKLMQKDCFVVLEYIRSSIEIIMSLKIEDLEQDNPKMRKTAKIAQSEHSISSMKLGQGAHNHQLNP